MAKYGISFEYDGKSSNDFGVILASIEKNQEFEMGLTRDVIKGGMNKYRNQVNHLGSKYSDVLVFDFTIVKNTCNKNPGDLLFTRSEVRQINAWLTSPEFPKLLHFNDSDEYIAYFAIITDVTDGAIGDKVYSLTYTVTCDSPYGYSDLITKTVENSSSTSSTSFVVSNTSDDLVNPVYPMITITPHSTGIISIKSNTDSEKVLTITAKKELDITINTRLQMFYDSVGLLDFEDIGLSDESDIYIPRLLQGDNNFTVTGDCAVTFSYRCPRKVGAF